VEVVEIVFFILIGMLLARPDLITFYEIWDQPLVHPIAILPVGRLNAVHHNNLEECY